MAWASSTGPATRPGPRGRRQDLLEEYAPDSATAGRFVDEARITGQLQHPGIPAVYQVGQLADGRPFLAMKLIKGRDPRRAAQAGPAADALAVFEAIAQAVGYAHATTSSTAT